MLRQSSIDLVRFSRKNAKKQNQGGLGQFRGLEVRSHSSMNPAMRVVRAIEEKDRDQQQRGHAQQRKNDARMLVAAVVNLHGDDHGDDAGDRPNQLLQQESSRANRSAPSP